MTAKVGWTSVKLTIPSMTGAATGYFSSTDDARTGQTSHDGCARNRPAKEVTNFSC